MAQAEEEERITKTQDLSNLIAHNQLVPAARLALDIGHPFKLLGIFDAILGQEGATEVLSKLVTDLEPVLLERLLGYIQEWNANSKRCHIAQAVLGTVLRAHPAERLIALPTMASLVPSLLA